ncbi:13592_t:CDS:2, partial [Dentiscutata heterogama]
SSIKINRQVQLLDNYNDIYTFSKDTTPNDNKTNFDNSNKLPIIAKNCKNQDAIFIPNTNDKIPESLFTSVQLKPRNPLVPLMAIENMNIPHSSNLYDENSETVSQPRRKKIDNSTLEELFEEQGISWNKKKFGKEYQLRNIRLDDDDIVNATKIIS